MARTSSLSSRTVLAAVAPCLLLAVAGCGDDDGGGAGACAVTLSPSADDQTAFQTALVEARTGTSICLQPGTYSFNGELTLTTPGVTVRGTAPGVVLDFAAQDAGGDSLKVTADDFVIEDLTLKNSPGDGVVVSGTTNATFRRLTVSWDAGSSPDNGAYAIYPVNVTNVLIEDCEVTGASDAGVYVGQSRNIIVRRNRVHGNVAGIEIENSTGADVYENETWDNAAGILVFNLPNLPVKDGRRARIFDNHVHENNHENFAIPGNIVASVPSGTGMLILAADETEVTGNRIVDNDGSGLIIVSWPTVAFLAALPEDPGDAGYDLYPETTYVHDNTFSGNGRTPPSVFQSVLQLDAVEDIFWDGLVDASKDNGMGQLDLCIMESAGVTFRDFDAAGMFMNQTTDIAAHACSHPALSPIMLNL